MLSAKRDDRRSGDGPVVLTSLPLGPVVSGRVRPPGWGSWLAILLIFTDAALWLATGNVPIAVVIGAAVAQTAWLWFARETPTLLNALGIGVFAISALILLLTGGFPVGWVYACVAAQVVWVRSAARDDRRAIAGVCMIGLAALLWANTDQVVAWLLARRLISEGGTYVALVFVGYASWAVGIAGVLMARSVPLWLISISGLSTVLRYFWRGVSAATRFLLAGGSALVGLLWLAVLLPWRGAAAVARFVWPGILAVLRSLWRLASGTARLIWIGVSSAIRLLWAGIRIVASRLWRGICATADLCWAGVSALAGVLWRAARIVGGLLWRGIRAVAPTFWLGVTTIALLAWSGTTTVGGLLWSGITAVAHMLWLGITTAAHLLKTGASLVAGALWHRLTVLAGVAWRGVTALASLLREGLGLTADFIGLVVSRVAGLCWSGIGWTAGHLRLGVRVGAGLLWDGISFVAGALWWGVTVAARLVWAGVSTLAHFAWLAVTAVAGVLWSGLVVVGRGLRLGVVTAAGGTWVGASTVARLLWAGTVAAASLAWRVTTIVARYAWQGISVVSSLLWAGVSRAARALWWAIATTASLAWAGVSATASLCWRGVSGLAGLLWQGVKLTARLVWAGVSGLARLLWSGITVAASALWLGVTVAAGLLWAGVTAGAKGMWLALSWTASLLWRGLCHAARLVWAGVSAVAGATWRVASAVASLLWRGISTVAARIWRAICFAGRLLWAGISMLASTIWQGITFIARMLWAGICAVARAVWRGISVVGQLCWAATCFVGRTARSCAVWAGLRLWSGIVASAVVLWSGLSLAGRLLAALGAAVFRLVRPGIVAAGSFLWLAISTIAMIVVWTFKALVRGIYWVVLLPPRSVLFFAKTMWIGAGAVPDAVSLATDVVGGRNIAQSASGARFTRRRALSLLAATGVLGVGLYGLWSLVVPEPRVVVVHWANSHVMRPKLLPEMSKKFNEARYRTQAGTLIEIKPYSYDSQPQVDDLAARVNGRSPQNKDLPDPTIVTPAADHWLVSGNQDAGHIVVDLSKTTSIARTWIGIVTYREMAECLGWPNRELGYADIIALRDNPKGWAAYPCAKTEWGQKPQIAFTDPRTSSTGRSALFSLFAIAAKKTPAQLTAADVSDPEVVSYVTDFQQLVDHYMSGTIPMNTSVYKGPRLGHFFILPEDNVIELYRGGASANVFGVQVTAPPLDRKVVMIYPKEGSAEHNHSASVPDAPWVTAEQREAAAIWIEYLRQDERQQAFMEAGFRPVNGLPVGDPISAQYGLDPAKPTTVVNPDRIDQGAFSAIIESWPDVKRKSIVTFVVDTSGTMLGNKLQEEKEGLGKAIDAMARGNQVGLVTFGDTVSIRMPVTSVSDDSSSLDGAVQGMQAGGQTALYDAIKAGIEMADAAPGDDRAIRAVVVLTDGKANLGSAVLTDIIQLETTTETRIPFCRGWDGETSCPDEAGKPIEKKNLIGRGLAMQTRHPIQIFYVGIGKDADLQVGRLLAEATSGEYQVADDNKGAGVLSQVIELISGYF